MAILEGLAALTAFWGPRNGDRRQQWRGLIARARRILASRGVVLPAWYGDQWVGYHDITKVHNQADQVRVAMKHYAKSHNIEMPSGWSNNIGQFAKGITALSPTSGMPTAEVPAGPAGNEDLLAEIEAAERALAERQARAQLEQQLLDIQGQMGNVGTAGIGGLGGAAELGQVQGRYSDGSGGFYELAEMTGVSVEAVKLGQANLLREAANTAQNALDALEEGGTVVEQNSATAGDVNSIKEFDLSAGVFSSLRFEGPAGGTVIVSMGEPSYDGRADLADVHALSPLAFERSKLEDAFPVDLDENGKAIFPINGRSVGIVWVYLSNTTTAWSCGYPTVDSMTSKLADRNGHRIPRAV